MPTYIDDYPSLTELDYWPILEDPAPYGSTTIYHPYIDTKLAHSIVEDLKVMHPTLSEYIDAECRSNNLFKMELSEVRELLMEKEHE